MGTRRIRGPVKYRSAAAFRTALEQRLRKRAEVTGVSLVRLRKQVVFERLLARLVTAASGRWVLKGALALDLRLGDRGRGTKDMDLEREDNEPSATADLVAAAALDLDDFFVFAVEKSGEEAPEGASVRYAVGAELAARVFEEVTVDVGFRDAMIEPDTLRSLNLLDFAGIDGIEIPVIPLEQHVAEKVHAYVRTYVEGRRSSRVKDLIDILLVSSLESLDGVRLRRALAETFQSRGGPSFPERLPTPPRDWGPPYRKLAREVGLVEDLTLGHREAAGFLDPILAGAAHGSWDPRDRRWLGRKALNDATRG
jgi:predicted nucleotidyltransferase component of viral defense system